MARGGNRSGRTYNRDARGRFASGGGSGASGVRRGAPRAGGGTLKARGRLARSRQRLAAQDPADQSIRGALSRRSQRGAVTKAQKALREARKANQVRLRGVGPKGVIRKKKGKAEGAQQGKPTGTQKAAPKLSATQRAIAERQRTAFKEHDLGLGLSPSYKQEVAAVMKKFGVDNRMATLVLMEHGYKMGNAGGYVNTEFALKTIKRLRTAVRLSAEIGKRVTLPDRVMPKGKRRKVKGPKMAGTIAKVRPKPARRIEASAAQPLSRNGLAQETAQRQVAGIRRRSAEKPDAALKRRSERARKRLDQLLDESRSLQTNLNRRRGRIEGNQREAAKAQLRKVEGSIARLRNAVKKYESPTTVVGSGGRAPATPRALEARYRMLQRRVRYVASNQDNFPDYDAVGRAFYGGALKRAQEEMNKAFLDVVGTGVSVRNRTRRQAASAQRSRTQGVFNTMARAKGASRAAPVKPGFRRGVSRQGNLLTGGFERVVSGSLRPLFGRIF